MYKKVPFNKLNGISWTSEDLQKKFGKTFVIASYKIGDKLEENKITLINGVGEDSVTISLSEKEQFTLPYKDFFVVDDRPPPCISNFEKGAFLMSYNPDRQWKRGFHSYNTYIYASIPPNGKQCMALYSSHHWPWLMARCIVNPQHFGVENLEDALNYMKNPKKTGAALSNRLWLLRGKDDVPLLYRRRALVGSFLGKRFFFNESSRCLTEELRDEIPLLNRKYAT